MHTHASTKLRTLKDPTFPEELLLLGRLTEIGFAAVALTMTCERFAALCEVAGLDPAAPDARDGLRKFVVTFAKRNGPTCPTVGQVAQDGKEAA